MTKLTQPINSAVAEMAADKLLNFQLMIRDIPGILRLTFGEPGFDVDDKIKQATINAINHNRSHYAESQGETNLRQEVVTYFNEKYHLNFKNEDNVIVTQGVSEAVNVVFQTLLNVNDGLIIPEPAYGPYFASLDLARGTRISIDTTPTDFKLTPEMVDKAIAEAKVPVKAILMNYPTNPTGVTYSREELEALAVTFKKHHLWVISDEIYSVLTYNKEHVSLAEIIPEQTIYINGLSKSHAMTGYRVGFILAQKEIIDEMQKVHGALVFALPTFVQDAALVALRDVTEEPVLMRDTYQNRRDNLLAQLQELGFEVVEPEGAFYLFAKLPADLGNDGDSFALELAQQGKVAVIPGSAFSHGEEPNPYIRISYAASDADLAEGMKRITNYIEKVRSSK